MAQHPTLSHRAGFTLIELLVSMVISVLIGTTCYGVLHTMLRSKAAVEGRNERLEALQNTLLLAQHDFMQMTPRSIDMDGRKVPPYTLDNPHSLSFHMQNWRNPLAGPRSNLARVRYNFVNPTLTREVWLINDYSYVMPSLSQTLSKGLKDTQFKNYISPVGTASAGLLPSGIEMILTYSDMGPVRVLIPAADSP